MYEPVRMAMTGGGNGAFIGTVHRSAAELDGEIALVCGCFSSDGAKSIVDGQQRYGLPADRCYTSYQALFDAEAARDDGAQFVTIVTPNHSHFEIAQAALEAGFHVVCDKPVCFSLAEAERLATQVAAGGCKFAVTHNYTGYPMVREARARVVSGALGNIRRVSCEYLQGWLAQEVVDNKQAAWRTDPTLAGAAGCFGDIGSHAENLVSYVTDLPIESLCADLSSFVPGRALDDDGNVLLRFSGGARGVISASQIAVGKENDLVLKIFGETGGLEWRQSEANSLLVRWMEKPTEWIRAGGPGTSPASLAATRLPGGHPEGYLEAFAEIYRQFYLALRGFAADYPGIEAGVRGMRFIEQVVASSAAGAAWRDM